MRIYVYQTAIIGGSGKNSLVLDTHAFRSEKEAKEFWTEALIVNGEVDSDLAVELASEWDPDDEDDELTWSEAGPHGSSLEYRLEAVDLE